MGYGDKVHICSLQFFIVYILLFLKEMQKQIICSSQFLIQTNTHLVLEK